MKHILWKCKFVFGASNGSSIGDSSRPEQDDSLKSESIEEEEIVLLWESTKIRRPMPTCHICNLDYEIRRNVQTKMATYLEDQNSFVLHANFAEKFIKTKQKSLSIKWSQQVYINKLLLTNHSSSVSDWNGLHRNIG